VASRLTELEYSHGLGTHSQASTVTVHGSVRCLRTSLEARSMTALALAITTTHQQRLKNSIKRLTFNTFQLRRKWN